MTYSETLTVLASALDSLSDSVALPLVGGAPSGKGVFSVGTGFSAVEGYRFLCARSLAARYEGRKGD